MKKRLYDFISKNPDSTIRKCAKALELDELTVLRLVNELGKAGILGQHVRPLGNSIDPDTSDFYFVCRPYSS